jgi:outer membrane protein assembly factor BamB
MFRRRPSLRLVAIVAAALLAIGGVAAYLSLKPPGDVYNPDVAFEEDTPTPTATPTPPPLKKGMGDTFLWPMYGYSPEHRRSFSVPKPLRAPFRPMWKRKASALLEFPPVIVRGRLIQLADDGVLRAVDKKTGVTKWQRRLGRLAASTPAVSGDTLYVTLLETFQSRRRGRVVAVRVRNGRTRWAKELPSRTESSPLVDSGKVYFGTEGGTVFALRADSGREVWRYQAHGAVKASPTLSDGLLYFGDYGGHVQAVRTLNGKRVWSTAAARRALRAGNFYATAAVAYGRVYVGSTDGREYSLSARTGAIAWARRTGHYVYSSAAVETVAGLGPTVFFGSYDGRFYALDARSGRTRWSYRSGGKISGSPTVIGDTVFFADLGRSTTYGLSVRTGRVLFRAKQGGYDPAVSDGRYLFLTGRRSLTALLPMAEARKELASKSDQARRRAEKKRRARVRAKQRRAARKRHEARVDRRFARRLRAARRACDGRRSVRVRRRCVARRVCKPRRSTAQAKRCIRRRVRLKRD